MIVVNKETCIGCGTCVSVCPDIFQIGDDGKSGVIKKDSEITPALLECAKVAVERCPVQAISIE